MKGGGNVEMNKFFRMYISKCCFNEATIIFQEHTHYFICDKCEKECEVDNIYIRYDKEMLKLREKLFKWREYE